MNLNGIKVVMILLAVVPLLAIGFFKTNSVAAVSPINFADEDPAMVYKTKCAVCHKATAEKFFDSAKMDDALVEIVLKGKKAEKPPNMPAFEEKGITTDLAKLLVGYMRQMRTPAANATPTPAPKP